MGMSWAEQVRFLPQFASPANSPAAVAVAVLPTARPRAAAERLALVPLIRILACIPKLLRLLLRICKLGFLWPHEAVRNYSRVNVNVGNKHVDKTLISFIIDFRVDRKLNR